MHRYRDYKNLICGKDSIPLKLLGLTKGDDSSLPVCSVSCTVHLQLFTYIDILYVRPKTPYKKQICSTLSDSSWPIHILIINN